jgi:hypothetical protein
MLRAQRTRVEIDVGLSYHAALRDELKRHFKHTRRKYELPQVRHAPTCQPAKGLRVI